jgi:hypothetical protein
MKMEVFPKNQQQMLVCCNRHRRVHNLLHAKWYWELSDTGWGMDEQQYLGEPKKKQFLDMRLPLTWLLSALVFVGGGLVTVGMQFSAIDTKMSTIIADNKDLKQQFKEQSEKYQALRDSQYTVQYTVQRTVDSLVIQVAEIQRTLGRKP